MAKRCETLRKRARSSGATSATPHNVTPRRFEPNLQTRPRDGQRRHQARLRVCTRCIRSNKVVKAA
jgi:ribosomal protein L28